MTIEQQIINAALAAVKELYGQEVPEKMVQLQKTKKEFEGNLTLVVFPFLKISRKKPDETAREIGDPFHLYLSLILYNFAIEDECAKWHISQYKQKKHSRPIVRTAVTLC